MSRKRNKSQMKEVHVPRENRMVVKADHTRRAMSPEELRVYLRESKRGTGIHGLESNRTKRRKYKQTFKTEDYNHQ